MVHRRLHRATFVNYFLIFALLLGIGIPPQALAWTEAPQETPDPNRAILVLQAEDTPERIVRVLTAEARRLGTRVISFHNVRGPEDDPRLAVIVRELQLAGFEVPGHAVTLTGFEELLTEATSARVHVDAVESVLAREGAGRTEQREGWWQRVRALSGQALTLGAAVLGAPGRLFGHFMTNLTGQRWKSLVSFIVRRDPISGERTGLPPFSVVNTAFWTSVLAVAWIYLTTFGIAPMLGFAPEIQPNTMTNLALISGTIFFWVFAWLSFGGAAVAWKDQVFHLDYDVRRPAGQQIRNVTNSGVNFGVNWAMESLLNIIIALIPAATLSLIPGVQEVTGSDFTRMFFEGLWIPLNALFAVFSFVVPQNLFGRLLNAADRDERSGAEGAIERAKWKRFWANTLSFCFWSFVFSTVVNLARFLPGWTAKLPLLGLGLFGVYGGQLWAGVRRLLGYSAPAPDPYVTPAPVVRYETDCTAFVVARHPPAI